MSYSGFRPSFPGISGETLCLAETRTSGSRELNSPSEVIRKGVEWGLGKVSSRENSMPNTAAPGEVTERRSAE